MQAVLDQNVVAKKYADLAENPLGRRMGFIAKLFGCRHNVLSRPFHDRTVSYRACLECGARRRFDTENFKTVGGFYYPITEN
ncbi:MAG: hypothetical protein ABR535_02850 [Pyrinomonadaceae bacterium]